MENRNLGYRSYWLAYFDLLGFESRVRAGVWPVLEEFRTALSEIRSHSAEVSCTWFSDTFLFYTPDDTCQSFSGIEDACESFFYRMIKSQIPVRGCLTIGDFYEDMSDGVLIGPALIEAYKLAEGEDWLGFVLSPDAMRRREQYGIHGNSCREYNVPMKSGKPSERLEAFVLSRGCRPLSPHEWWQCLDGMEHEALTFFPLKEKQGAEGQSGDTSAESERERVLQKYRNSKEYLRCLYPQLADFVQGEYGPIPLNKPEVKRKIRELSWHLK